MFAAPLLLALVSAQPAKPVLPLWEGKAPYAVGDSDTDKPNVTVYLPPKDKANGAAVVVCPGGGYGGLANDHEGKQIGEWLNGQGVTAFVLKYRTANKDHPGPLLGAPLADAQRAIRLVRFKAKDYGIDPARVGIWGFSAGGHLASTAATHFHTGPTAPGSDAIDAMSDRPDFAILAYPVITMEAGVTHGGTRNNLIGPKPDEKLIELYSNEKQVTKDTPPTFIFHTSEDKAVLPENATRFYLACKKAGVPVEMHIYEKGAHGVGLAKGQKSLEGWPDRLAEWMKARGLFEAKK